MNIANAKLLSEHLHWLKDNGRTDKFNMRITLGDRRAPGIGFSSIEDLVDALPPDALVSATECGTVGCFAGHAALIGEAPHYVAVIPWAEHWLGLNLGESRYLFYGGWTDTPLSKISLASAIKALDAMIRDAEAGGG